MSRRDQLPLEAVRDLLGITRALYAAWKRDMGISRPDLEELAAIGKELKTALDLAKKTSPETIGMAAAWDRAESACARLGRLISINIPLAPTVEAAAVRIRRIAPRPSAGEERRAAGRWRR
jgi:hypothetical protein